MPIVKKTSQQFHVLAPNADPAQPPHTFAVVTGDDQSGIVRIVLDQKLRKLILTSGVVMPPDIADDLAVALTAASELAKQMKAPT